MLLRESNSIERFPTATKMGSTSTENENTGYDYNYSGSFRSGIPEWSRYHRREASELEHSHNES